MRKLWWWFLARFRLSNWAICEMSKGKGWHDDYHDYPDDVIGRPEHFMELTCKRCGKSFFISLLVLLLLSLRSEAAPKDAVVRITSHGCSGTVFAVKGNRSWIVTCAHAFKGREGAMPVVVDAPGARMQVRGWITKIDHDLDLAMVQVESALPYVCHVAPESFRPSRCLSVGWDEMKDRQTVQTATVTRHQGTETHTWEKPWEGRSGGALIFNGRLAGVVSGYTSPGNRQFIPGVNHGIYVSLPAVRGFLWPSGTGQAQVALPVRQAPVYYTPQMTQPALPQGQCLK
jgi:hypothetical protein